MSSTVKGGNGVQSCHSRETMASTLTRIPSAKRSARSSAASSSGESAPIERVPRTSFGMVCSESQPATEQSRAHVRITTACIKPW